MHTPNKSKGKRRAITGDLPFLFIFSGGAGRDRTDDLLNAIPLEMCFPIFIALR
jgi:hypothetical protein